MLPNPTFAIGSWRRVTRRIVAGAVCALTVSSLLMPSVSLAAEWVKVGGNKYNTAASDEAGTWSWDGADDLKLNNYNGGEIQAQRELLGDQHRHCRMDRKHQRFSWH